MNFDDYMKKIQNISNILEKSTNAESILNSKELNIEKDFQYICLSSASNCNLVNEVIARLAQNGNQNIVKNHINDISMSMWKDLFDKNESIKEIFIQNFDTILENTIILTFREIERFINDIDTCNLIYNSLNNIIKKLCTYDRASLILILQNSQEGIQKIKQNLEYFFQKGEFDISTTYSKIVIELSQVTEINNLDILKVCNKHLSEMLGRETAIDNETNKLLNWIYDTYEETPMSDFERNNIKQNIDTAILKNFENILDKANYDRQTIKILKQFDCTKEKFEKNKNHYIEKSNCINMENRAETDKEKDDEVASVKNKEIEYIVENMVDSEKINKILSNTKNQINKENLALRNIINETNNTNVTEENQKEIIQSINNKNNIITIDQVIDNIQSKENNIDLTENILSKEVNKSDKQIINNINDDSIENSLENNFEKENSNNTIKKNINISSEHLINSYIYKFNQKNGNKKIEENMAQSDGVAFNNQIKTLILNNIEETDQIIDKVLKRNTETKNPELKIKQTDEKIISEDLIKNKEENIDRNNIINIESIINVNRENVINNEDNINVEKEFVRSIKNDENITKDNILNIENSINESKENVINIDDNISKEKEFIKNIESKINTNVENIINSESNMDVNKDNIANVETNINDTIKTLDNNTNNSLVTREQFIEISRKENIIKRIWKKLIKIFKTKNIEEKI